MGLRSQGISISAVGSLIIVVVPLVPRYFFFFFSFFFQFAPVADTRLQALFVRLFNNYLLLLPLSVTSFLGVV